MKIKARYFYFPLLGLIPTLVSLAPVEILGVSGRFLQRIMIGNIEVPYWDLIIIIAPITLLKYSITKGKLRLDSAMAILIVSVAMANYLFRNTTSFSQGVGLLFGHSSILIYYVCSVIPLNMAHVKSIIITYRIIFVFFVILGGTLVLSTVISIGVWEENITQIPRFSGEGTRLRWETLRATEKIVLVMCASYCGFFLYAKNKLRFAIVLLLLVVWQIISSSRGGVLLVVIGSTIGYLLARRGVPNRGNKYKSAIVGTALAGLIVFGIFFVVQSEIALSLVQQMDEVTRNDSIRSRMSQQAMIIVKDNILFGQGYFDLYDRPEWQSFVLDNMLLPVHNIFLQYTMYIGLVGVVPLIIIFLLLAKNFFSTYVSFSIENTEDNIHLKILFLLSLACYTGGLYMFYFQSLDRITAYLFWTVMGLSMNESLRNKLSFRGKP